MHSNEIFQSYANSKKLLERKLAEVGVLDQGIADSNERLEALDNTMHEHTEARELIQKAAQLTQQSLETTLSEIVTQALQIVFNDLDIGFQVQFETKRNSTECAMYLTEGGELYDPLNSCGFGAADVISFALRIAMWSMNKTRKTMVFDEPFRNLDAYRIPQASLMVSTLSKELGIQMIIVTHEEELAENADKVFGVVKKNGVSKVVLK